MEKNKDYKDLINQHAPSSPTLKNSFLAFLVGGGICFISEIFVLFISRFIPEEKAYLSATLILILIASLLTALGVFDKIARFSGGGTLVPVTGFSNSVSSVAIDSRSEGFILGVGSKIFTVAGPVILYATAAGTLYGFIYYIFNLVRDML
ncbi:MAG: SpoVA/SpoVAEb family sporulation membrane protein [Clostridia bacterium]|nr:SpoVA/SpoVAEb family sporulation membrane protein [Clostridia bacterium]